MRLKKYSIKLTSMFLSVALIFSITACNKKSQDEKKEEIVQQEENQSFDEYMESLLREDLVSDLSIYVQFVENPDNFGITDYNKAMTSPSKENFDKETKQCEERLAKLTSYDYNSLTEKQKLDYDTIKTYLENRIEIKDCCYYREPLSTLDGDHIVLPGIAGLHASRFFETLANRKIEDVEEVKKFFEFYEAAGNYLKDVAQFEREKAEEGLFMTEERASEVLKVCKKVVDNNAKDFVTSFNDELDKQIWMSETDKNSLKEMNKDLAKKYIVPGYQAIVDAMKAGSKKAGKTKGLYETELGKKYYAYILKSENNIDLTPEETATILEEAVTEWLVERDAIIKDNPTIQVSINEKLAAYTDTDSVVKTLNENAYKDFPDININWGVKDMPQSMNGFAMGLFYPQAIDSTQALHAIYAGTMLEPKTSSFVQTIGHEGVPGHLYNYCYFMNLDISTYRKFIGWVGSTGTLEGWTTYIEEYAYKYMGLNEQEARYLELARLLELGIVERVDIGVNYEGWQLDEITTYLQKTEPLYVLIAGYIQSVVQDSINSYGPYCIGYIELTNIKEQMRERLGDRFNDKSFHESYLNVGPTTFDLLKQQLLGQ